MNKRPKSREETPKEGSDSARRYRTATICGRAAQNARVFDLFAVQNIAWLGCIWTMYTNAFPSYFRDFTATPPQRARHRQRPAVNLSIS